PDGHPGGSTQAALWTAFRDDRALLSCRLPEPDGDVLTVHDSLFRHGGERSGAGRLIAVPALRWHCGPAGHRRLHDRCLLGLTRQGSQGLVTRGANYDARLRTCWTTRDASRLP